MSKQLRCGVVGLGMGKGHINGYTSHPDCEMAAIADLDEKRLASAKTEFAISDTYTDAEAMFQNADLDLVSIAVPNRLHHPLVMAALDAGLHVLCEKPMAINLEQAMEMEAKAIEVGKTLAINFSFRFSSMSYALKQQVDAGIIGEIYFGRTVWHRRRGLPGFGGWFGNKEHSGGGPLIDLGVHRIDLALWLMGHPTPVSVFGSTYNVIAKKEAERLNKHFSVEDLAAGIVKFDNGATLIVEASWALNNNENEHMITSLYGDKGGLVQKNRDGTYDFTAEIYTEEGGNLYTKVLDRAVVEAPSSYHDFVNSILEGREPVAKASHGVKVQMIIDGLYRSAEEGKEIVF
ncbi:MAG: Gfo/Idh/MocA family oxidoreductase [Planctomycetota bacterium]|nr:Gfo/Idh/MocA family oxidoreductase [Planctomycetota bacterium]MDA1143124.1 Gfo/Idh/MocA family oxidoreductase [Planctomycetota bacterium]